MNRYGQFCPVSKACEILGERWTILIVRELLMGATRFHELRRTLSHISPTVLSKRLRTLEDYGLLVRKTVSGQQRHEYRLTAAGRDLQGVVFGIGEWGMRWARGQMSDDELDVEHLMVYVCRTLRTELLPDGRTVLKFHFTDRQDYRFWWVVVTDGEADLCIDMPGEDCDVRFVCDVRTMVEVWMGDRTLADARRQGALKIHGQRALLRNVSSWLGLSIFAGIERGQQTSLEA
jgi:DNA-binding HxlR family transcriptional regulator